jgi:hypothetical protein
MLKYLTQKILLSKLRKGFNGNDQPLFSYQRQSLAKNQEKTFLFQKLSDDMDYSLYFMISSDDPSYFAVYDPMVYERQFKIEKIYNINDNQAQIVGLMFIIVSLFT